MQHNLDRTVALLSRTPASLDALLRGLPEEWSLRNEGENTWSGYDVLGHLIYGERTNWIPRAKQILEFGESKPFEPFDRLAQFRESQAKSLPQLLDEFTLVRSESLRELRSLNLQPADFARTGRHPGLGVVTLSQLLSAWAAHDLTHLHQVTRVMAHQYREAVGPWTAYLGVLKCSGHSEPPIRK
jgi:DinB superfamily